MVIYGVTLTQLNHDLARSSGSESGIGESVGAAFAGTLYLALTPAVTPFRVYLPVLKAAQSVLSRLRSDRKLFSKVLHVFNVRFRRFSTLAVFPASLPLWPLR